VTQSYFTDVQKLCQVRYELAVMVATGQSGKMKKSSPIVSYKPLVLLHASRWSLMIFRRP